MSRPMEFQAESQVARRDNGLRMADTEVTFILLADTVKPAEPSQHCEARWEIRNLRGSLSSLSPEGTSRRDKL
jgi:hypothetical protein